MSYHDRKPANIYTQISTAMSEERKRPQRRRRNNNNHNNRDGRVRSGAESMDSRASSVSRASTDSRASSASRASTASTNTNPRGNNRRRGNGNKDKPSKAQTPKSAVPKEETRDEELALLNHRIGSVKEIKLINSSNRAKIYSVTFSNKEAYKLTVPMIKRLPIQLQSLPEKPSNPYVIKNFNNKVSANDKSLLFYFNLLVNDHHHLVVRPECFKLYNLTKTQPIEKQEPKSATSTTAQVSDHSAGDELHTDTNNDSLSTTTITE